jgi:hypothetical protein
MIDGLEQRTSHYAEVFAFEDEDTGPTVVHTHYVIECVGYPLTTWLKVNVSESDVNDITSFDIYADEGCQRLLIDGVDPAALDAEQLDNLYAAVSSAQLAKRDRELFAAKIARAQALMADLVRS